MEWRINWFNLEKPDGSHTTEALVLCADITLQSAQVWKRYIQMLPTWLVMQVVCY